MREEAQAKASADVDTRRQPGRLILVLGPSGAGKDTLIAYAREACRGDPSIVFPRRVVTRPATAAEDHDTLEPDAFDKAAKRGAFALCWDAHGLRYGIPAAIDCELRAGRTVVCNVSRTVAARARTQFARVSVVLVTAPEPVLIERLRARRRATDGLVKERIARSASLDADLQPDLVIDNSSSAAEGATKLLAAIYGERATPD